MKIRTIDHPHGYEWQYWYNTDDRAWYAAKFDKEGNQIGDSINAHDMETIILMIGINWWAK